MCILGLTWAFGFTYFASGSEGLAIVFTLLNSSQGVWILVFHVLLNKKAVKEVSLHTGYLSIRAKVVIRLVHNLVCFCKQKTTFYPSKRELFWENPLNQKFLVTQPPTSQPQMALSQPPTTWQLRLEQAEAVQQAPRSL